MRAISGKKKTAEKSPNTLRRNGLLAKIHVAKRDLGLAAAAYRDILGVYGVASAAALSVAEMEDLVDHFVSLGFAPKSSKPGWNAEGRRRMVAALQDRIRQESSRMENADLRLSGIVRRMGGVDDLRFCRSVARLKRILKVISIYRKRDEDEKEVS
jgi:phage gp16-like protein